MTFEWKRGLSIVVGVAALLSPLAVTGCSHSDGDASSPADYQKALLGGNRTASQKARDDAMRAATMAALHGQPSSQGAAGAASEEAVGAAARAKAAAAAQSKK